MKLMCFFPSNISHPSSVTPDYLQNLVNTYNHLCKVVMKHTGHSTNQDSGEKSRGVAGGHHCYSPSIWSMMTSHSIDEVKAEQMLCFHPSTAVNSKLWMMNSSMLKKGSCPSSLAAKTCPFGSWACVQPSNTSLFCQSLNPYGGDPVPLSSYKTLSTAAFSQHTRKQRNRAADGSKGRMW